MKKTHLKQCVILYMRSQIRRTRAAFKKLVLYIKTNYIGLLYVIFKPVEKLQMPENSSL